MMVPQRQEYKESSSRTYNQQFRRVQKTSELKQDRKYNGQGITYSPGFGQSEDRSALQC